MRIIFHAELHFNRDKPAPDTDTEHEVHDLSTNHPVGFTPNPASPTTEEDNDDSSRSTAV